MGCCFTVPEEEKAEELRNVKKTHNLGESCRRAQKGHMEAPLLPEKGKERPRDNQNPVKKTTSGGLQETQREGLCVSKTLSGITILETSTGALSESLQDLSRGSSHMSASFRDRKPLGLNDLDHRLVRLNTRSPKAIHHAPSRTTLKHKKNNRTMSL
eukprot:TRINITY_DN31049_c0_g1_i1.p1 TRINITY_DN31049_c0_g1~~TRINITY_DN31049_c0_g1_i1.p1  ORF type:complete len:157 (+),score=15.71 TRINITY_DN31049_c0_g1_i1:75-545(+)